MGARRGGRQKDIGSTEFSCELFFLKRNFLTRFLLRFSSTETENGRISRSKVLGALMIFCSALLRRSVAFELAIPFRKALLHTSHGSHARNDHRNEYSNTTPPIAGKTNLFRNFPTWCSLESFGFLCHEIAMKTKQVMEACVCLRASKQLIRSSGDAS
jgi:hypothetical protein